MAKTKRVEESANTITEGIVNTILLEGYSASRINTQGQYDENLNGPGAGGWRPSGSRKGYYDISCCIEGHFVVIEVKYGKGDRLRKDQKDFRAEVLKAGGVVFECGSWEQFLVWWDAMKTYVIPEWKTYSLLMQKVVISFKKSQTNG